MEALQVLKFALKKELLNFSCDLLTNDCALTVYKLLTTDVSNMLKVALSVLAFSCSVNFSNNLVCSFYFSIVGFWEWTGSDVKRV